MPDLIPNLLEATLAVGDFREYEAGCRQFSTPDNPDAGSVRVWKNHADSVALNRIVHVELLAGPVSTSLFFVFGNREQAMPHLHAQMVSFPPDGCVFNIDLLPRVDAVTEPDWFEAVYHPLTPAFLRATKDKSATVSQVSLNPALDVYLTPWGLGSGRSNAEELEAAWPHLMAYHEHFLGLAGAPPASSLSAERLAARDEQYLAQFFREDLDQRAWKGLYRAIGEDAGKHVREQLFTDL